jgi:hypothetical protein
MFHQVPKSLVLRATVATACLRDAVGGVSGGRSYDHAVGGYRRLRASQGVELPYERLNAMNSGGPHKFIHV